MHELALCQSVVDALYEQAGIHGFERVTVVRLEVGALSCVAPDSLQFCFAAATRGTLAEGARLELIRLPGKAWCLDCGATVALAERYDDCPRCVGPRLRVTEGDEMRIKDLEVV
jgi:hydrogenase nickel incorporation protein HypA/HybF